MLKKIFPMVAVTTALLISGCSSTPKAIMQNNNNQAPQALIKIANGAGAPSWAHNESKAFHNVLQAAATVTLKKGYKYFAIVSPDEISNTKGSLDNTAKELLTKCDPNGALFLSIGGSGLHHCGVYNTQANMVIAMYNQEQKDFTVINAQNVINYFKANDLYDDDGLDIINK